MTIVTVRATHEERRYYRLMPDGRTLALDECDTAFQASSLRTSLYSSIMAFEVSNLVSGLGLMIVVFGLAVGGLGVALAGLAIPAVSRKLHVEPIAAH